jgi:hypothetical protein
MNRVTSVLCSLLFATALPGCSGQPVDPISVIHSAADLSYHYESGQAVEFIDNAELTDLEVTIVLEALDQIDRSKSRLETLLKSPEKLIAELPIITFEYAKIRSAYLSVRQVVLDNAAEYSPEEWYTFEQFDTSARNLDAEFVAMSESLKGNGAVRVAFKLADSAIKIAALL